MHKFHSSIIRAYDIRGIYNETLFDIDAFFIAKSFASFLHKNSKNKVVVGCDGRISSQPLKAQLIRGLIESKIDVIDVGVGPTPMIYFSLYQLNCDAAIMVTGSHNPKNHNGFKIMLSDRPFFGDDIINLANIAAKGDFAEVDLSKTESLLKEIDVKEEYIKRILADCEIAKSESELLNEIDDITPKKTLTIAWDAGNGAAGEIMKKISERIFGEHFLLFEEIDGNFPNHHPDPTEVKNLQDLKKLILEKKCDIGIAFDGDGDRIGVMDDEGEVIWGDQLLIFYAREILQKKPAATIIADVKASNILFDEIKKSGGNAVMHKTGHSFIKAKMKETKAALAGEMSGHIFFADKYYGFDDAIYAAIRIINILVNSDLKLSDLRKSLPKTYSTEEIRINCDDDKKFKIMEELKNKLIADKVEFNDIDGVRVCEKSGWWLIRASNTQAVLVVRAEANSRQELENIQDKIKRHLELFQL
jgi:phosphomannomutase